MAQLLVIDDDAAFRDGLAETLRDLGHEVAEAANGQDGLAQFDAERPRLVFLDLRMPGLDGMVVLKRLCGNGPAPPVPVVVLTAYASSTNTIGAMRLGAFDHLTKPLGRADIADVVARALSRSASVVPSDAMAADGPLVGNSPATRAVQKLIGMAAASDATVLVTGETGTGKELVARALHEHGPRAAGPFVSVNCAAIPAELLESELFGHVAGAFTGAVRAQAGRFREAQRGTLLLDEIGDMDAAMQAKILRVLQERVVTPVGGRPEPVDVRVVAATHRDLLRLIDEGRFRADLYYRLHVIPIALPPLRDRADDIMPLAEHFLHLANPAAPKRLSSAAGTLLAASSWPGNVRELRNAVERAAALARGTTIEAEDLAFLRTPASSAAAIGTDLTLPEAVAELERVMIRRALAEVGGSRTEAARKLGIHRQLLYDKMKRHGLGDVSGDGS
ncbi:sigma-54 dependent transcriptional regulator [Acidisphaera sp. L21]|uniref:sigma-54-dependent transcriptional regulator n=1 Tax=Acidisphaera sp. L21 TaxID=1641851 RepID=UPI00131D4C31|nr:sigma-54 dependent transcriptional regulator [Acidisphaera sp. L21]